MDYTQIVYEVADHIATITLNRPEQLNAFTNTMMREVIDAFDRVDADDAAGSAPAPTFREEARRSAAAGAMSRPMWACRAMEAGWCRCASSSAPSR